jgi:hypothetical protein
MATQNIKEELNRDMENLRKKNQTEILEIKTKKGDNNKHQGNKGNHKIMDLNNRPETL